MMEESLEQLQARHRKEQRDLVSRITQKKKNATKKTRKGVNDECAELERQLKLRQEEELRIFNGEEEGLPEPEEELVPSAPEPTSRTDDISSEPASATLLSTPAPPTPQQPSEPGRKRNRQKERLARRAAEVEAASARAADEASTMTDHRGGEKKRMEPVFSSNNLVEHEIAPDGHCLFSSFADGLASASIPLSSSSATNIDATPRVEPYKIVRRTAADYMLSHGDDFAGFLEEPLEEYATRIRDTAEWGGQLELSALANAYGVEVRVVQDGRTEVIVPSGEMGGEEGAEKEKKTVWLAYYRHGFGLGEHYNALRRREVAS
jgi:OTU domain-containing protein 6